MNKISGKGEVGSFKILFARRFLLPSTADLMKNSWGADILNSKNSKWKKITEVVIDISK